MVFRVYAGAAARFYDPTNDARGRDAGAEAGAVVGEIRRRCPGARSLLDVACGTGAHLPRFAAESGRSDDVAVARVVRSRREGMRCDVFVRYVAASADGVTTADEHHALRLSDPGEFEAAYRSAGLGFERLPHMLHPGRAVYVGAAGP